ncbi:acetyl-CoA synthetase-like protein [Tothia fuscella]|uniref:Acetyl-CoA synthetase-like protein n=1 Tax=Tothia fuscella TaxID=1048955 RepID=A0A9P4P3G9_9PEZI|nr:acetyl-CoA synthetase-like protein [Tothia fuscella]
MDLGFNSLDTLSASDRVKFNNYGRGLVVPLPFSLIHHGFEAFADRQPAALAVIQHADGQSITYDELERRSNILANRLIDEGIFSGLRVVLVFHRSIELVVAILAVLKANCQYVPLDGGIVPDATLSHILQDTRAPLVLCLKKYEEKIRRLTQESTSVIALDTQEQQTINQGGGDERRPIFTTSTPNDGAYIIYTSGTTGKPKGVDVSHQNLVNILCLKPSNLGISPGTKVAQLLNIAFDLAVWEILGTLVNGGTLCLRTSDWNPTLKKVDTIILTPSILARYSKSEYPNIKTVAVGGEPCPTSLADSWGVKGVSFYNICGPTEITILNTVHIHHSEKQSHSRKPLPLCIGKPIPNTNVYIVDEQEQPVPIGATGVMWVGGLGVSQGYLNLPHLSSSRFKPDKFTRDGRRMFNTGDLCKWRSDGTLEHHGRIDDQVKVKGFRVELDGISAAVEQYPGVVKASTLISNDMLHAFYCAPEDFEASAIREHVARLLPYYCVPDEIIYLPSIPLTPNGKVDKKRLREMSTTPSATRVPLHPQRDSIAADESSKNAAEKSLIVAVPVSAYLSKNKASETRMEKSIVFETVEEVGSPMSAPSIYKDNYRLPKKNGFHGLRWIRHKWFSLYRRLFSVVLLANIAMMLYICQRGWRSGTRLSDLALATATNLLVSVLVRQDHVVNFLFAIVRSVPTSAPLYIRRNLAKVYHIGGIHSGAAVAAVFWFIFFAFSASRYFIIGSEEYQVSRAALVSTYLILLLFLGILVMAYPTVRQKYHNAFELSHRWLGWTILVLLWVQTILVTDSLRNQAPFGHSLLTNPSLWVLAVATASIIYPWLLLRKVRVRSESLSDRAIRLHFDYCSTIPGTAVHISYSPLKEWHAFATIAKPGVKGFSLLVSRAGDWTKGTIERMPTTAWKKGVPACGVLAITPLFKRIVLIATGSGIGPCLPVIYANNIPCRIVWSTPNPEETYGREILDAVMKCDPNAEILNTKTMQGRPDLVAIAYRLYKESNAEAVCIISNPSLTGKVVYAMEARGIPAYGAIWDS